MAKESFKCRICRVSINEPPSKPVQWALCAGCAAIGRWKQREWMAAKQIAEIVNRKQIAMTTDDAGNGWLVRIEPQPPKPAIVDIDDDGFVRYRDMSSPTGQTWRPGVDTCIGGEDPRLDAYRPKDIADGDE